jgi:hypothetical protein
VKPGVSVSGALPLPFVAVGEAFSLVQTVW